MTNPDYDVLIIGAGFTGIRSLYEARQLGLSVKVFEAGTDVGGTWYWNRYPGARTDSESWVYCFDFDSELLQDYDHKERFPTQEQSLAYIGHVVDRFDLRKDIQLSTRIQSAVFDEANDIWTLTTTEGVATTCRWFVAAGGLLSVLYEPPFPGLETFQGEHYQTARWPRDEKVSFEGKRVAVIGNGATGIQVIPVVAQSAGHLTVFQRTANYVIPARNYVIDDDKRSEIKANYDKVWEDTYNHPFGMWFPQHGRLFDDFPDPAERRRIFDSGWEAGGFRFLFETFDDLLFNQAANDAASEFIREKIRSIVHDPATAELLCPDDHPLGGKRTPAGHFYYEAFNRDNVDLVSIKGNPITEITPTGITLEDGTHVEVDMIIFALGFDAITGSLRAMDVRGKGGRTIADAWGTEAPEQFMAMMGADFPNMFTPSGPQGAFGNFHSFMNKQVAFLGSLLKHAKEAGVTRIEVDAAAASGWADMCETLQAGTLLPQGVATRSWFLGANIPGKRNRTLFFFGGVNAYNAELQTSIDEGFPGFVFGSSLVPA